MENKDSQRGAVVELIEVIANQIASYSHHYELYNSIETDLLDKDQFPEEEVEKMQEESSYHYYEMLKLTEQRRRSMRMLKALAVDYNEQFWCLVKHAIATYQFAQEVLATDMYNADYAQLAAEASQYMYKCVSRLLWVDVVTCWRCLADELADNKPLNN